MKLPFCYLEHLDSLRLGHAKQLIAASVAYHRHQTQQVDPQCNASDF